MSFSTTPQELPGTVRETFKHAAVYSGAGLLGSAIGFIMLPFYAHILRDVGYGVIAMIEASLALLASLFAYNFESAVLRIYHEEPDSTRKPLVVIVGTILVAAIVLILGAIAAAVSRPLSILLFDTPAYWNLICLALGTFCMDLVAQSAQTILVIQRRSLAYSSIGILRLVVGAGMNILLVVVLRWDLLGFFLSGLVVALVSMGVSVGLVIRICGTGFDLGIARRLLGYQLPLIPGSLASFFSRQVERVVVRYQLDLSSLGVLEMGYKLPALLGLLIVGPFLRSWSTQRLEIADQPRSRERIGHVFVYFLYLCLFGGLVVAVNIRTILHLLTPPEFWRAFSIARIQVLQVIMHGAGMHLTFGLIYAKRTSLIARLTMVTAVLKVGLAYAMINFWGLYGAAWSSLASATVFTVWGYVIAQRHYRIQVGWYRVVFVTGTAAVLFLAIDQLDPETVATWGAPVLDQTRIALGSLSGTWLGQWQDGKVLRLVSERCDLVHDLVVRTLLASVYFAIIPLVHEESRRKLRKSWALRRWRLHT